MDHRYRIHLRKLSHWAREAQQLLSSTETRYVRQSEQLSDLIAIFGPKTSRLSGRTMICVVRASFFLFCFFFSSDPKVSKKTKKAVLYISG